MEKIDTKELISKLIFGSYDEFCTNILVFLEKYDKTTSFDELNDNYLRERLWKILFHYLTNHMYLDHHHHCLAALRILSRDKTNLEELINDDEIKIILENAGLTKICEEDQLTHTAVTIESLKLLCNLLFNSIKVQQSKVLISSLVYLIDRVKNYAYDVPHDVKLFDMRILFLITALNTSTRDIIKSNLCGDVYLIKVIEDFALRNQSNEITKAEEVTIICEALKVLFNLYIQSNDDYREEQEKYRNLALILYKLLTHQYLIQQDNLESHVVNLLTVIPYSCYESIVQPAANNCENVYENMNMSAVSVLVRILDQRLNCTTHLVENVSPVITALIRMVTSKRIIRKYVKLQILPPLKDVMNRPEEGTTLRAKLCKLLTSHCMELCDLVAELLFILCKKNEYDLWHTILVTLSMLLIVSRMVKYTGYGNAAGMFAKKGLLGYSQAGSFHSSDSEDSETEEYLKYKEQINPVTGCLEHSKPNPLQGMTEEQKEFEALQLVNLVDKLTKQGVVCPCRIGENGKLEPIEHVLELQSELPKQQYDRRNSDSE